ncbi:MAG: tetratricopeptide repeat protein [Bacteroidales bacterium]|jgi:tetratricopeptide (TPR) repeat protein|nr:tetratricopeptide repeat protein [Bacteroidales bacterium]
MNEDERDFTENEEILGAVSRFTKMCRENGFEYFDVFEIEDIIDYSLDEGESDIARRALAYGKQVHPDAVSWTLKEAQIALFDGKYKKSLALLDTAENLEEKNPDIFLTRGSALLLLGNYDDAVKCYDTALEYDGDDNDELLYNIGVSLEQSGHIKKAIEYLNRALEINPQNVNTYYELGYCFDKLDKLEKAIIYYNKYLDIDPFNHNVWYNLGIALSKTSRHDEAIEAYDYAIALDDKFAPACFNKANSLFNNGSYAAAAECYREYLKLDDKSDDAWSYLGECYLNMEKYREASRCYDAALHRNRQNAGAWYGRALVNWYYEKLDAALANIRFAIRYDSRNSDFWLLSGKIHTELGHTEVAEVSFRRALRLNPKNQEAWVFYADMKAESGGLKDAITILKRALRSVRSDSSLINYRLTAYLLESNDETAATRCFEKALQDDFNGYHNFFDYYPPAKQNESIKKLISKHLT